MKLIQSIILTFIILVLMLVESVNAQQNLAQEAYAIFEQSCVICHGENGAYRESLIIDHTTLIENGKVVPGKPDESVVYQRLIETDVAKRMPLGQPALDPAAIETIRQWIAAGAPNWDANPAPLPNFITSEVLLETIENHVNSLSPRDKSYARYFTLTHLYNAGETTETLNAYRRALSKLINSLSWGREIVKPQPIDAEQTVFYIDLRHYEWDVRNEAWTQIEQVYPYQMTFDAPTQTHLKEKLTLLQQETNSEVPFVNVDWFIATASLPPLYNNILALPETANELEESLDVSVTQNLQNAPGIRVWRAGFNDSGVSRHNRVVERHTSSHGAYWKSYDFAGSAESQNIFTHPLDFTHDGGEIIFNLPNGLQAYFLVDGVGSRLDVAPTDIVSNPAASDPAVYNGLSCIGCHTEGMKTFEDEVRAVVEQTNNPSYDRVQALELYVEKSVMDGLVAEDTQRYKDALEAAGGVFGGIEPIQRFQEVFQGPLSAAHAAAAVGLETNTFLERVSNNVSLQNLLGALVVDGGTIKRDAWTSSFHDVVSEINSPDTVLPPVEDRPERIPGASVHIPDPNLRATLNRILDKLSDAPITVAEMESFIGFGHHNTHIQIDGTTQIIWEILSHKGINDLTGLEFARNLRGLVIANNQVSDLSPVENLTNLEGLYIEHNNISDLSPVENLTNLTNLSIGNNNISDLSPVENLTNLTRLSISNNDKISDITPISSLKKLQSFSFENCPEITSLSALEGLTELEHIQAGHNFKITDLSPLAGKEKFKSILLWGPPISDLSPLANLPNIENINMCGNEISVIPSFENAPKLKKLYIFNNNVSDVSTLQNLKGLERLNLRDNKITDVTPLSGLTNLKWLDLTHNPITDFSPLSELAQTTNIIAGSVNIPDRNLRAAIAEALGKDGTGVIPITRAEMATLKRLPAEGKEIQDLTGLESAINLDHLNAHDNQIADLSPLSELINLRVLNLWNNPIESLSPIAGLSNLEELRIIGNEISDFSPLAGLVKLRHFLSWGNPISDLSPLVSLTQLKTLDICGSQTSDISSLAKLTELKELYLAQNRISDVSSLSGLTSLTRLVLKENNISDVSPLATLTQLKWLSLDHNSISDFSPLAELSETTISRTFNPSSLIGGPKIEGPWLWVTVSGERLDSTTDFLAEASGGIVTEKHIAANGAKEDIPIGNNLWTAGKIAPVSELNIIKMLASLGIGTDNDARIIYGSIALNSPSEQHVNMFVGSGDRVKVWLNGELVHQVLVWRRATDYQDYFPVTLKQGTNVLLVAVDNGPAFGWSGFFGFEEGTEYTLIPPGTGFSFTVTETDNLLAGDTFTLNLNAENITDLAGWQADITFGPNVLEAVEVSEGDFLKSEGGDTFFQAGTIDNTAGKITDLYSARIAESGVSGTGTLLSGTFKAKAGGETQVTLENFEFISITGDIIPTVHPNITITVGEYPAWDVNQDGRVSIQDLVLVANDLGSGAPANLRTDVNRDGEINIQDLIIVAQHMGESTDSAAAPIVALDSNELTPAIVQAWIEQAQVEDDGSIVFQQGIENLQKLLATLLPEKTALLANYPNPFNPETWIPYHLAKPSDVTLTIYAANGVVVRTLALGHQAAGIYQNRDRAVHWDGRNDVGEAVASGIYFYTLTTGDFTSTRKMLIWK